MFRLEILNFHINVENVHQSFRDAAAAVREFLHPRRDPAVHQLQVSPDQSEHGIWSRDPVLTSDWLQLPRPRQPLHPRPRRPLLLALHKLLHPVVHQEGRSPQEVKGTVALYLVKLSINKSISNLDVNFLFSSPCRLIS